MSDSVLVKTVLKKYRKYRLKPFEEIIREIFAHFSSIEGLKGKNIIELGPGTKIRMLNFLNSETQAASVQGIGRSIEWFWLPHKDLRRNMLTNSYLLPELKTRKSNSIDLIFSRHVLEEQSINPFILLGSSIYWKYIKENRFKNPGTDFPASAPNIQAVFKEAFRLLRHGGIIISEIGRESRNPIDDKYLKKLKPKRTAKRSIGRFSSIYTVVK